MKNTDNRPSKMNKQQQQFINLYCNAFPRFARFVSRMGGNLDEAKDIFQDALLAWYEKSDVITANITKSETAYVLGIAKHLWIKHFNKSLCQISLSEINIDEIIEEEPNHHERKLLHLLKSAGSKCMELLKSFYYDKHNPAELANEFGFSGERSATAQKYKCLEKVRNEVKRKSLNYADFID